MDGTTNSLNAVNLIIDEDDATHSVNLDSKPRSYFHRRVRLLRTLCLGLIVGMVGVNLIVSTILWFVFDGLPLAGNRYTVSGVSIMTLIAAVFTLLVPALCWFIAAKKTASAVAGAEGNIEKLTDAYAGKIAVECLPVAGLAFVWAILFHLTADPLMLLFVGGLIAYMIARYPTSRRANAWFARVTSPALS